LIIHYSQKMKKTAVIAIFDIGKTNKKLLLFDEHYQLVQEVSKQLTEIKDEDGFECEDIQALTKWIKDSFGVLLKDERFTVKALNFSAYGASFVYLNDAGEVFLPLYNYLKPYPAVLQKQFYNVYGGESKIAKQTASPVLGNLNSGMQLYRLKYQQPADFNQIKFALHLPQYLSYIFTNKTHSDITSIGCHTNLWDFENNRYHPWVKQEGIEPKLAAMLNCESVAGYVNKTIPAGVGLHDSSAALIPYLAAFKEPFILISTGTWCISLNPFNHAPLTDDELRQDCLCYLTYQGTMVKASRLFAGYEHEQQVKKLSQHFGKVPDYFSTVGYDPLLTENISVQKNSNKAGSKESMAPASNFAERPLNNFKTYETAYHQLIADIIQQQVQSTNLVLHHTPVKRIFVDGGFSKNAVYMHLLAKALPGMEIFAASVAQASALGAALVMHRHWNNKPLPSDVIELKLYTFSNESNL
jgi:sugar (pentulose or hexulose) kinase